MVSMTIATERPTRTLSPNPPPVGWDYASEKEWKPVKMESESPIAKRRHRRTTIVFAMVATPIVMDESTKDISDW